MVIVLSWTSPKTVRMPAVGENEAVTAGTMRGPSSSTRRANGRGRRRTTGVQKPSQLMGESHGCGGRGPGAQPGAGGRSESLGSDPTAPTPFKGRDGRV